MTRLDVINAGFASEVKKLTKQYPNDMDLGKHIRILVMETEGKIIKIKNDDASVIPPLNP